MEDQDAWHLTGDLRTELGKGDPFAAAIRATRMSMLITDPRRDENPIVFANDSFLRLTGYGRDEVLGRNCRFLQGPETSPQAIAEVRDAIAARRDVAVDLLNYRKDGTPFWNALYISPVTNEDGELLFFFASQLDVTRRVEAAQRILTEMEVVEQAVEERTAELKTALDAQKMLLHEVDHRVKNNLQMISSMILMQSRNIADPGVRASLVAMLERVEALSTVHRRLYQSEDVTRFDVADFARDLIGDLLAATGRHGIRAELDLHPVEVPAAKAAPVALVINELLTNALKHAFPDDREGVVRLSLRRLDGRFRIEVEDNGVGNAAADGRAGFGRRLVATLARQLAATVTQEDAAPGLRVVMELPVDQRSSEA